MSRLHRISPLATLGTLFSFVIALVGACAQSTPPPPLTVSEISLGQSTDVVVIASITKIFAGGRTTLAVEAKGDAPLEYKWEARRGSVDPDDKLSVMYMAPSEPGPDSVTVTVIDKHGQQVTQSILLEIIPRPTPTPTPTNTPTATSTPTRTPTATLSPTPPPSCEVGSSAEGIVEMFKRYDVGDYKGALVCIDEIVLQWSDEAKQQQAQKQIDNCDYTPKPDNEEEVDAFWKEYWALNDVGTAWFMRGEILRKQGNCVEAVIAYETVIKEYSCAYAWDPRGWYWSVAKGAQTGLQRCQ